MVIRLMRNTGTRTINYICIYSAHVCVHSDKLVQKGRIALCGCFYECSIALYSTEHTESYNTSPQHSQQPPATHCAFSRLKQNRATPCILSAKTAQSGSVHSLG